MAEDSAKKTGGGGAFTSGTVWGMGPPGGSCGATCDVCTAERGAAEVQNMVGDLALQDLSSGFPISYPGGTCPQDPDDKCNDPEPTPY